MRHPMILITIHDLERLSLAIELLRDESLPNLLIAWALAGQQLEELRAVAVVWDWQAQIAGNPEVW